MTTQADGPQTVLVQVLLPLYCPQGRPQPRASFRAVREELVAQFDGLTAYTRAPAVGLWKEDDDAPPQRDDVVVYEVMAPALDRTWWAAYRARLEARFAQQAIVVRAQRIERL